MTFDEYTNLNSEQVAQFLETPESGDFALELEAQLKELCLGHEDARLNQSLIELLIETMDISTTASAIAQMEDFFEDRKDAENEE